MLVYFNYQLSYETSIKLHTPGSSFSCTFLQFIELRLVPLPIPPPPPLLPSWMGFQFLSGCTPMTCQVFLAAGFVQLLESPGNLLESSYDKSVQKLQNKKCIQKYLRRTDLEILGMKRFKVKFGEKNRSESWKSL